ncbi:MAG: hypothetical protein PUC00_11855 [Clostridiales bacterium]|nr:hypothetical protein [Clostridiales bacterium]
MTNRLDDPKTIRLDRMRYAKNTFSSRMTYLAILFNVLYFVSIYESDVGSWYYQILIGASIVYNLVFMLVSFLASEGVKNYKASYAWLLLAAGVGQIVRIFILPMQAYRASVTISKVTYPVMKMPQLTFVIICLAASALCCFAAGIVGVYRSRALRAYNASLDEKVA